MNSIFIFLSTNTAKKKGTFDKTSDNSDLFSHSDQDNEVASSMSDLSDFEYLCYLVVFIVTWGPWHGGEKMNFNMQFYLLIISPLSFSDAVWQSQFANIIQNKWLETSTHTDSWNLKNPVFHHQWDKNIFLSSLFCSRFLLIVMVTAWQFDMDGCIPERLIKISQNIWIWVKLFSIHYRRNPYSC